MEMSTTKMNEIVTFHGSCGKEISKQFTLSKLHKCRSSFRAVNLFL